MSWLQLHGEVWPVTPDEGHLQVHILAPDAGCPRVSWTLSVRHLNLPTQAGGADDLSLERSVWIQLRDLMVDVPDWRRLAGLEIRADAAWHATQEFVGPYVHAHHSPRVEVTREKTGDPATRSAVPSPPHHWMAHDFTLRLGNRDGWSFPCELDAWLIPSREYFRQEPEPLAAATRFADGLPDLRLITRATFIGGTVQLTRGVADDPVPAARASLLAALGCEELLQPVVHWRSRSVPYFPESEPTPHARPDVQFYTPGCPYLILRPRRIFY